MSRSLNPSVPGSRAVAERCGQPSKHWRREQLVADTMFNGLDHTQQGRSRLWIGGARRPIPLPTPGGGRSTAPAGKAFEDESSADGSVSPMLRRAGSMSTVVRCRRWPGGGWNGFGRVGADTAPVGQAFTGLLGQMYVQTTPLVWQEPTRSTAGSSRRSSATRWWRSRRRSCSRFAGPGASGARTCALKCSPAVRPKSIAVRSKPRRHGPVWQLSAS